jgi:hypothetical protein
VSVFVRLSVLTAKEPSPSQAAVLQQKRQIPPDLVVKPQPVDIVAVILWLVLRPRIVYQREIKG